MNLARRNWPKAKREEERLRKALVDVRESPRKKRGEASRAWWASVRELFDLYGLMLQQSEKPEPLPGEFVEVMKRLTGDFAVGQVHTAIEEARKETGGGKTHNELKMRDIQLAVAYHQAATDRIEHNNYTITIDDPHPTKTVSEAFGVGPRTVQDWNKNFPAKISPLIRSGDPKTKSAAKMAAKMLEKMMRKAGQRYRQAGPGHEAIRSRNAKRGERNPRG